MERQNFIAQVNAAARMHVENEVSRMIRAIRERTPAFVQVDFSEAGDVSTVRVVHADGFTDEPQGPYRFLQQAKEWCATHPVPGVVI
jgi:hypothetical protein